MPPVFAYYVQVSDHQRRLGDGSGLTNLVFPDLVSGPSVLVFLVEEDGLEDVILQVFAL